MMVICIWNNSKMKSETICCCSCYCRTVGVVRTSYTGWFHCSYANHSVIVECNAIYMKCFVTWCPPKVNGLLCIEFLTLSLSLSLAHCISIVQMSKSTMMVMMISDVERSEQAALWLPSNNKIEAAQFCRDNFIKWWMIQATRISHKRFSNDWASNNECETVSSKRVIWNVVHGSGYPISKRTFAQRRRIKGCANACWTISL